METDLNSPEILTAVSLSIEDDKPCQNPGLLLSSVAMTLDIPHLNATKGLSAGETRLAGISWTDLYDHPTLHEFSICLSLRVVYLQWPKLEG